MSKGLQSGYLMRSFFAPAIKVLNRLNYTMKFALMGLIFLIAVTVVVYALFASLNQTIHTSQRQLQGLALIKPVSRTIQAIQQHRGISAALFNGNGTMQDRRTAKEAEIGEAFRAMEQMLPPSLAAK